MSHFTKFVATFLCLIASSALFASGDYLIGPGDSLSIRILGHPELTYSENCRVSVSGGYSVGDMVSAILNVCKVHQEIKSTDDKAALSKAILEIKKAEVENPQIHEDLFDLLTGIKAGKESDELYIAKAAFTAANHRLFGLGGTALEHVCQPDLKHVDSSGEIRFPFIGYIKVSGLTTKQVGIELTNRLNDYIESPWVDVEVAEYKSKIFQALGFVHSPGDISIERDNLNVRQAISLAGGYVGDPSKLQIILSNRDGIRKIDVDELTGKLLDNIIVKNGDIIRIDKKKFTIDLQGGIFLALGFIGLSFSLILGMKLERSSSPHVYLALRILAAMSAACIATVLPGSMGFENSYVQASGAIGIFLFVYLANPPKYVPHKVQ